MLQGLARFFRAQTTEEKEAVQAKRHADGLSKHGSQDTPIEELDADRRSKYQCLVALWKLPGIPQQQDHRTSLADR